MSTTEEHEPPSDKWQADESDIGPEPDWLSDADTTEVEETRQPLTAEFAPVVVPEPINAEKISAPREHPWLWGLAPLVFVIVVGLISWFSTYQTLNGTTIWQELSRHQPALLPARWTMLMWWILLPLLGVHLALAILPSGREPAKIRVTGPLIVAAMIGASIWMLAQIWQWQLVGLAAIAVTTLALASGYFITRRSDATNRHWRRTLALIALTTNTAFSLMLLIVTWQSHWHQPLGVRGTGAIVALVVILLAAAFALYLKDGIFAIVLAVWFLGVAQQQWSHDKVMSLVAIVALIFTAILAGLGVILEAESRHDPTTPTSVTQHGRTSFFRRSHNSPA